MHFVQSLITLLAFSSYSIGRVFLNASQSGCMDVQSLGYAYGSAYPEQLGWMMVDAMPIRAVICNAVRSISMRPLKRVLLFPPTLVIVHNERFAIDGIVESQVLGCSDSVNPVHVRPMHVSGCGALVCRSSGSAKPCLFGRRVVRCVCVLYRLLRFMGLYLRRPIHHRKS